MLQRVFPARSQDLDILDSWRPAQWKMQRCLGFIVINMLEKSKADVGYLPLTVQKLKMAIKENVVVYLHPH